MWALAFKIKLFFHPNTRWCVTFGNIIGNNSVGSFSSCLLLKPDKNPTLAVCSYLFNIFRVILHIERPSPQFSTWGCITESHTSFLPQNLSADHVNGRLEDPIHDVGAAHSKMSATQLVLTMAAPMPIGSRAA
jgi:hypothetical protein